MQIEQFPLHPVACVCKAYLAPPLKKNIFKTSQNSSDVVTVISTPSVLSSHPYDPSPVLSAITPQWKIHCRYTNTTFSGLTVLLLVNGRFLLVSYVIFVYNISKKNAYVAFDLFKTLLYLGCRLTFRNVFCKSCDDSLESKMLGELNGIELFLIIHLIKKQIWVFNQIRL